MLNRLLKPEEVAEKLGVSPQTVRKWLAKGYLKGIRVGKLWRVSEEDLKKFLYPEKTETEAEKK